MTAEIAILNRSAVALATDSAITLSSADIARPLKIYETGEKLFELSHQNCIGIMIYNNLEFLGIPLEILIKQYRSSPHCKPCDNLFEAARYFITFLETWPVQEAPVSVINEHLRGAVSYTHLTLPTKRIV